MNYPDKMTTMTTFDFLCDFKQDELERLRTTLSNHLKSQEGKNDKHVEEVLQYIEFIQLHLY